MHLCVFLKWPVKSVALFCAIALMLLFLPCRSVFAQQKPADQQEQPLVPTFLSTLETLTNMGGFASGTGTFLTKQFTRSLTWNVNSELHEVRFKVPPGYTRFSATVGLDDTFPNAKVPCTFSVRGVDASGNMVQLDTEQCYALGKPSEINVPVGSVTILILGIKTDGDNVLNSGKAWWGDPHFDNVMEPRPPTNACTLVYDEKELKQKLLELSQDVMKNFMGKELSVALFLLDSKGMPLDPKNATAIQEGLHEALNQAKPTDLTLLKESYSDTLKDWQPGDDLNDANQKALHKAVDSRYLLLGKIADREENALISAAIYDLRTGKPIASEESKVRIPIREHQVSAPRKAPDTGPVEAAEPNTISVTFTPDEKIRVRTYLWVVDGKSQTETNVSGLNTKDISVPANKKPHRFTLRWNGYGCPHGSSGTTLFYKTGSVDFEAEVDGPTQIEVILKVEDQIFSPRLNKQVFVNRKAVPLSK